jgi:hypothetical protein
MVQKYFQNFGLLQQKKWSFGMTKKAIKIKNELIRTHFLINLFFSI